MKRLFILTIRGLLLGLGFWGIYVTAQIASIPSAMALKDSLSQNNTMGTGQVIGPVAIKGTLVHSKGRMGQVGSMLISGDLLSGGDGHWKPEYEALVGKVVIARGEYYRYTCSPIEQCREGGVIDYLQSITSLKAPDPSGDDGYGEILGMKTVQGILRGGKGEMAEVGTMMIPGRYLSEAKGRAWKPEYEALVGKQVEARGYHYRYYCGANEQCLTSGSIDWLLAIEYLKGVE